MSDDRLEALSPVQTLAAFRPGDGQYGKRLQKMLSDLREAPYDRDDLLQFVAFVMSMMRRSKAQLFQDLWALWEAGERRGGYFVEFGAGDGVRLSNTYLLETEMQWTGVLAEPNPGFATRLKRRACHVSTRCVFSRSGEKVPFLAARQGMMSRMADVAPDGHEASARQDASVIEVETISLNDLLTEAGAPRRIDFLSADTEGSELEILSAFDFDRWDVRAIAVEHNKTEARKRIYELLTGHGYRRKWREFSRFDDWYVRD